jgi:hypothetical protein
MVPLIGTDDKRVRPLVLVQVIPVVLSDEAILEKANLFTLTIT